MSKRTIADFCRAAFLARDKATADAIIKDAEEAIPPNGNGDDEHKEPDGDEGDTKHASNIHIHVEHGAKDTVEGRITKLEDSVGKLVSSFDSMTKAIKDGELPPWLKKDGDGDGDDDKKEETADEGIEAPDGEKGELSMEKLGEAEPELMNADPSKKTGEMRMGDAAAVTKNLTRLVKDIRARAEVLSPGIKLNLDAKLGAGTQKALCDARRSALAKAITTDTGRKAVGSFTAADIKGMSCDMARTVFKDASERMAAHNNSSSYVASDDVFVARDSQIEKLKGVNAANRDFWAKQTGAIRH